MIEVSFVASWWLMFVILCYQVVSTYIGFEPDWNYKEPLSNYKPQVLKSVIAKAKENGVI